MLMFEGNEDAFVGDMLTLGNVTLACTDQAAGGTRLQVEVM